MELEKINFDERGLVPAIVQDSETGEVLTLAYMNAEGLARTLQTGEAWLSDRRGAPGAARQRVVELRLDCDGDTLIVRVETDDPACHTGERTCFFRPLAGAPPQSAGEGARPRPRGEPALSVVDMNSMELGILLNDLYTLIRMREAERPEGSYTSYLFNSGLDKILKKIGEEATETVIAAKNGSSRELTSEMADLLYHMLVLMVERGLGLQDVCRVLAERAGRRRDPSIGALARES